MYPGDVIGPFFRTVRHQGFDPFASLGFVVHKLANKFTNLALGFVCSSLSFVVCGPDV